MKVATMGAGGCIGGALVNDLVEKGHDVRAYDIKPISEWIQVNPDADNHAEVDLTKSEDCKWATKVDHVYNLAADMGGIGFIEQNKALCMDSVSINANLLKAAIKNNVVRYFFSSSACIYPTYRQSETDSTALKEDDAYPAQPEPGYGEEKLYSESMTLRYGQDFDMKTRVARYHNVYGPYSTYDGGREKAPAAICRKIAQAKISMSYEIEIWGDGEQTRSFMYIDDCVYGTNLIMNSDVEIALNLGSSELVTINQLVDIVEDIAGVTVERNYDLTAPQGVRGRNSENSLIKEQLGWEPSISLRDGLEKTYEWVYNEIKKNA